MLYWKVTEDIYVWFHKPLFFTNIEFSQEKNRHEHPFDGTQHAARLIRKNTLFIICTGYAVTIINVTRREHLLQLELKTV